MKKYFTLFIISISILLAGSLLTGCGKQPVAEQTANAPAVAPASDSSDLPVSDGAVETAAPPAPTLTDADLDREIKNLDSSLDPVKSTGFEAASLSDKDLGL